MTKLCVVYSCCFRISTHTPLAGRDNLLRPRLISYYISTHTPLAGRDPGSKYALAISTPISTHTPLAGRDMFSIPLLPLLLFLLTRPLRDVTS